MSPEVSAGQRRWLFAVCFISLVATSFGFVTRNFVIDDWAAQFDLSKTQQGEILGVGLWPFAISIVLFSLVIDRIGYGRSLAFAFVCHVASIALVVSARGYWWLYAGTFLNALGNGTVEAVINPVIATMYKKKTQWLNILHAGWPGGIALGGLLTLALDPGGLLHGVVAVDAASVWKLQVGLVLIPTLIYGVMLLRTRFPVSERVAAGVSYRAMLEEAGVVGMALVTFLIVWELTRVAAAAPPVFGVDWGAIGNLRGWSLGAMLGFVAAVTAVLMLPYAVFVRFAPGRPLFILLLLIMIPLATTELGTDAWMKELMEGVMRQSYGMSGLWVLIYSATIMMTLRLGCGPIVEKLRPLGVLAVSSLLAAVGIASMSQVSTLQWAAVLIPVATTVYGLGQTFFWPTTLGVVAERFPRGGALTLNAIGGVGMLGVGIIGSQLLGFVQDTRVNEHVRRADPALHAAVIDDPRPSIFGSYRPLDDAKVAALPEPAKATVDTASAAAKRDALLIVAALPAALFVVYLALIAGFKARGGYRPVELEATPAAPPMHTDGHR